MGRINALWWVASDAPLPENEARLDPLFAGDEDGAAATALLEMLRGACKVEGSDQLITAERLDAESIISTFEAVEQHVQSFTPPGLPLLGMEEEDLQSVTAQVTSAISDGRSQAQLSEWEEAVAKAESWKRKQHQLLSAAGPQATRRCRELAALDPFVLAASLLFLREQDALPTKDAKEANALDLESSPADVERPMQQSLETAEPPGRSSSTTAGTDVAQIGGSQLASARGATGFTGRAQDESTQYDTGPCLLWWIDSAKDDTAEAQTVDQSPAMEMADPASQAMLQLIQGAGEEELNSGKREALGTLDFETMLAVLEAVEGHMCSTSITGTCGHEAALLGPKVLDYIVRRVSTQVDLVQDLGMPGFLPFPDDGDAVDAGDWDGKDARQDVTSNLPVDTRELLHWEHANSDARELRRWEHAMTGASHWFAAAADLAPLLISANRALASPSHEESDGGSKEGCINIAAAMKFATMGGEDVAHRDALAMELLARDGVQLPEFLTAGHPVPLM